MKKEEEVLNYFQKYLYLSTTKTTAFYFYSSPFFGQYFVFYFKYFFVQVAKLLLDYPFRILFTPLLVDYFLPLSEIFRTA